MIISENDATLANGVLSFTDAESMIPCSAMISLREDGSILYDAVMGSSNGASIELTYIYVKATGE